ncbi:hypothetical protein [Nitrosomonas sp.]|uniref:beta strand repeat-containing protein n=1 Tax=Nitrosomonas sp. TaxID=42353 RepID=UPI0025D416D8|nr:hypothetical protein [Nitrosomonas sp.]
MGDKQLEAVQIVVTLFNAAPGAHYLNEFVSYLDNTGSSTKELASILAQTDVFKQSLYSDTLSNTDFAYQFVKNAVGLLVSNEDKTWAASEIEKILDAGESRGNVLHSAATALASVDFTNASWGLAAQQFHHKIEVAAFYSIDQSGSATSLSVLQRVIEETTSNIATVTATKALLASGATGKVIDGYVKEALVFADLNGDRLLNSGEKSSITDAFGNFLIPSIDGFGNLITSGGVDIATGKPFEGIMTAPAGATVITPLTTLVDKIMQDGVSSAQIAVAKVLATLGLNTSIGLLHFDPIKETIRQDSNITATNSALAIHGVSVQIEILVGQTAALLTGAGIAPDETTAIDWAYDALAAILANSTGRIALNSKNIVAELIKGAASLSSADNATLIKASSLLTDATQIIANLNQGVTDIFHNNSSKLKALARIAAVQIVAETIETEIKSGAAKGNIGSTVASTTGSLFSDAITKAGPKVGDVNGNGKSDAHLLLSSSGGGSSAPSTNIFYLATNATAFSGTAADEILSISTAPTWTPLVMTAVVLDGDAGTNTLSVQDGSSIALATVLNFTNLIFDATGVVGANNVTMSAVQHQNFTGTITAPGTGINGEQVTIVGDGNITALADIETYVLEDDSTNARTVIVISTTTNVTANSASDAVTVDLGALAYTGTVTGEGTADDTLGLGNGADISGGIISNVEALTLASGAAAKLSATQNQNFTGTITAPGSGVNGEQITIAGDGAVTTLSSIENYSIEDDSTNARTVTVTSASTNVTANSASDAVTVDLGALTYTGTITGEGTVGDTLSLGNGADINGGTISDVEALTLVSGAAVRLSATQNQNFTGTITAPGTGVNGEQVTIAGDGNITTLVGIETYVLEDDSTNARTLTLGSEALTLIANNASDIITINAAALEQNTALTLGISSSALAINNLIGNLVASNLTGALTIITADATDNGISIVTGSSATSVDVAAGAASDTVSINAAALANNTILTVTSGTAAAGSISITDLTGNLTVSDPISGIINLAVTDNTVDDGIAIVAGTSDLAISNVADGDTVTITGFSGSTLTGAIAGATGKFNITAGTATSSIMTGAGDDTFTFAAATGLTSADSVDGGAGTDRVALTGNTAFAAATYFDNVHNIETITLGNTNTAVTITTQDTLVAAGAILTLSTTTTGGLTFNGTAETDGAFNITGGSGIDNITGGSGNDTLTGNNGNDSIPLDWAMTRSQEAQVTIHLRLLQSPV